MPGHLNSTSIARKKSLPEIMGNAPTLLVIDCSDLFVELAHSVGQSLGFQVKSSATAGDLEQLFDKFNPAVIVFDFFCPDMDGIELINWLHQRQSSVPVLLTAARSSVFLSFAKQLAAVRGLQDVDFMITPASNAVTIERLTYHLTVIRASTR